MKLAKFWIWWCALANLAGWGLSAVGQLNRVGYSVYFTGAALLIFLCRENLGLPILSDFTDWKKILRRFRRPLPGAFALLVLLIFIGSVIYPPSNYTGLNYHLARVLQWLTHGQWFWIHTAIVRMNYSGCAFEWLTTPVVLFTNSDRALFLVNFIPFLLLPGLVFSVFTRLGVSMRVAWWWMWLLPTGYNFLLQAGSIGNDTFGVIFALAAVAFACRAWATCRISDFWTSLLAMALLTGTKPTSLPLLLPWAILIFRLVPQLRHHWLPTLPVILLAAFSSFAPIAWMNWQHSGDWLGRSMTSAQFDIHQPWVGIAGNFCQLFLGNFTPPIFPFAGWWNYHVPLLLPNGLQQAIAANFFPGVFTVGELPTEDWVGLGFGVSTLLIISVGASGCRRGLVPPPSPHHLIPLWIIRSAAWAAWVSLLAYSVKSGITNAPRLITPYYPLLLPALLLGAGQAHLVRRRWWRWAAGGVLFLALVVLVLSPDRPLWPAQTILSRVVTHHPQPAAAARALEVYSVYAQRNDALAGVRALLPPDTKVVGFIGTEDDCDISLWRPLGTRRVEHFLLSDPSAFIRQQAQYVVLGGFNLQMHGQTIDHWLQYSGAELVGTTNVLLKIAEGLQPWYVVRFQPE